MVLMGHLPAVMVSLTILTFIITYLIAVARQDVAPGFPYISDTGAESPESNIFAQFLNITAVLALCTMYFHYKAVETTVGDLDEDPGICRLNKAAMGVGLVSCLGVSMVANFQEGSIVEPVHFVGAVLTFGLGIVYCYLESALSYKMYPCFNTMKICRIRLTISIIATVSLAICVASAVFAYNEWYKTPHTAKQRLRWGHNDPGFAAHVVSTVFEWATALIFFAFFLTYTHQLIRFDLEIRARPIFPRSTESMESSRREPNERTGLIL